ncbi:ATP synthase F1 subunit gamma [[Mycoplasma] mobile]|uniref:ATP synthase gamma chain n=1 Tax=Mycoplasma mobile (strain ATCC 43663 / 163K / NCTC 11711) TaxID=267748 RepID=ATPG_MYCM1|nr:ATP synthase F1 subunit gamma [[Mycoplasma] mobile]Q6KI81.1 RecName: Full=ATP synthase gamma chain; AltName: Full=ATP synthase F1 sector gamma subunit; AltName: Full=F-ATPase gamma subunit [Mycoplasma mobile 163K]AAT27695.1 ATP synthase gamma chain [Mycoplasma mobile 163K]
MAELQKLSSRLKSVKVTRKITKAMELVAASKIRRAKESFFSNKEYFQIIQDIFDNLASKTEQIFLKKQMKFDKENNTNSILYIVINSDLGLCGAYNSSIAKEIKKEIKSKDKLFLIGKKGLLFLGKFKTQITNLDKVKEISTNYKNIKKISEKILSMFKSGDYKSIKIVYTKYVNAFTYLPTIKHALPILKSEKNINEATFSNLEFEPDPITIFQKAIPLYFSSLLYSCVLESHVSEVSSRRIAMENATKNADELGDQLKIELNTIRQSKITQEITEIVAGSETEI